MLRNSLHNCLFFLGDLAGPCESGGGKGEKKRKKGKEREEKGIPGN